ncbi:hypothetical protein [Gracilimonas sediminicola]|uniref:hypothetical protein n=1 Tax=Gracilimonas sediminicola TaxID=2952158 RepID=UPI0038D3DF9E
MLYYIEIKKFTVPDGVIPESPVFTREEGFNKAETIPLKKLHPEALAELCDEFRRNVFEKAECEDPGDQRGPGNTPLYR